MKSRGMTAEDYRAAGWEIGKIQSSIERIYAIINGKVRAPVIDQVTTDSKLVKALTKFRLDLEYEAELAGINTWRIS
jgi:hypothetical protein